MALLNRSGSGGEAQAALLDWITTTAPIGVPSKLDFAKDQDSERKSHNEDYRL
jgi:hypothetical protein